MIDMARISARGPVARSYPGSLACAETGPHIIAQHFQPWLIMKVHFHARKVDFYAHKVDLHARKVDLHARKVDLHARKVDFYARKVDLHARKVDLHARKVDFHARKVDLHASVKRKQRCPRPSSRGSGHSPIPLVSVVTYSSFSLVLSHCLLNNAFSSI